MLLPRVLAATFAATMLATALVLGHEDAPVPSPDLGECEAPPATPSYAVRCVHAPPEGFDALVAGAASEYGVDPRVLATTVYRESGCDPDATGASGDAGLGQVVPSVWVRTLRDAGILRDARDLYDPATNLRATAFILARAHRASGGDLHGTFRRYNGGGKAARAYADAQVAAYHDAWADDS